MVKFFLKNEKQSQRPSNKNLLNNNKQKQNINKSKQKQRIKNKKVLDYRIVIWKKLYNLIKAQHSMMIQKIIRKIKETKQKMTKRQEQLYQTKQSNKLYQTKQSNKLYQTKQSNKEKQQIKQKIQQFKKQLNKLDTKYRQLKHIKKLQIKKITIYVIVVILKISPIYKILEKAKLNSFISIETSNQLKQQQQSSKNNQPDQIIKQNTKPSTQIQKYLQSLKNQLQNCQQIKNFISKLSKLTAYQKQLEEAAQLVDLVQQKKLQRKTKLKQRKARKYQRQHPTQHQPNLNQQNIQINHLGNQSQQIQSEIQSQNSQNQNQINDDFFINNQKLNQKTNKVKNENHFNKQNKNNQSFLKNNDTGSNKFNSRNYQIQNPHKFQPHQSKNKPIYKQRTQFKKTGRNKVKYQKQQKKMHFKNNPKPNNPTNQSQSNKSPSQKGRPFSFSKQQAHPSWKAKQQLKQQVFIKPFQGKKILL